MMASLTGIRLLEGAVIDGGVYFGGDVVILPDGEAQELVRQGKAELVDEVRVSAPVETEAPAGEFHWREG